MPLSGQIPLKGNIFYFLISLLLLVLVNYRGRKKSFHYPPKGLRQLILPKELTKPSGGPACPGRARLSGGDGIICRRQLRLMYGANYRKTKFSKMFSLIFRYLLRLRPRVRLRLLLRFDYHFQLEE